jgi:7SK snRNA methylphosphate capping enzyme
MESKEGEEILNSEHNKMNISEEGVYKNKNNSKKEKMMNKKREREENKLKELKDLKDNSDNADSKNRIDKNNDKDTHILTFDEKIERELSQIQESKELWNRIKLENLNDILVKSKEFIFGNYDRYYYKRYLEALKDPRLSVFKTEWFKDKRCLDIGCNDGTLTIMIAVCYQPKIIEGVDIDFRLIGKALKNMKYVMRNNLSKTYLENLLSINTKTEEDNNITVLKEDKIEVVEDKQIPSDDKLLLKLKGHLGDSTKMNQILNKLNSMPKSFLINLGYPINNNILDRNEKLITIKNENNEKFPKNIYFSQMNYIAEIKEDAKEKEQYDTILCLSTVKWIHLNYGDIGVKILFYNIYNQLRKDGLFIFEPQCWKSYKKRKNLTSVIKSNFSKIKFRPEHFKSYLEETYGYECIKISNPPSNTKKSFDRPIYVFQKK